MEWKKEIAIAYLVQQKLRELDKEGLWNYHIPELAATELEIATAERAIGEPVQAPYREFLKCANGWNSFFQAIDLFGTPDLTEGPQRDRAYSLLNDIEDIQFSCGISLTEVFPIAVSSHNLDVFVMTRSNSKKAGRVLWLNYTVIDSWLNFEEFFKAMIDYNRGEIARFSKAI